MDIHDIPLDNNNIDKVINNSIVYGNPMWKIGLKLSKRVEAVTSENVREKGITHFSPAQDSCFRLLHCHFQFSSSTLFPHQILNMNLYFNK